LAAKRFRRGRGAIGWDQPLLCSGPNPQASQEALEKKPPSVEKPPAHPPDVLLILVVLAVDKRCRRPVKLQGDPP
jgi:hypothetical protein